MTLQTGPLIASYGGGHAAIIAAVSKQLQSAGLTPTMLGFTTAYQAFLRQGLPAQNVSTLIRSNKDDYAQAAALIRPFLPEQGHPDISEHETWDYFTIGLHDLITQHGIAQALDMVAQEGRLAFLPIETMEAYLNELRPSVIVTTTSPRFELALIRAGKNLGIPTVSVADIYLQRERSWVMSDNYADHLCVLNSALKAELDTEKQDANMVIHATGNPAFDDLISIRAADDRRADLRKTLGVSDKTVILWPSASVRQADFTDKPFANADEVAHALEPLCAERPDYTYMLRPHPNAPHGLPDHAAHGILDPGLSPEDALLVADVVCFEVSTMGLQAHLIGLPTLCVGFEDIAVFPKFGKSLIVPDLAEAAAQLKARNLPELQRDGAEHITLSNATKTVTQLIIDVAAKAALL